MHVIFTNVVYLRTFDKECQIKKICGLLVKDCHIQNLELCIWRSRIKRAMSCDLYMFWTSYARKANEQIVVLVRLQNPRCYRSIMEATASIRIGFLHHPTPTTSQTLKTNKLARLEYAQCACLKLWLSDSVLRNFLPGGIVSKVFDKFS